MDRIFVPHENGVSFAPAEGSATVDGASHRHLAKALRLRAGQRVCAVDGAGHETVLEIEDVGREGTRVRVIERRTLAPGAGSVVTLAVAPPKGDRFDVAVEKACEIGVGRIVPLVTERSVVRTEANSARLERWRRIAIAAMVQSEQAWAAEIGVPRTVDEIVQGRSKAQGSGSVFLLAQPEPDAITLRAAIASRSPGSQVVILVGPEGGFTGGEVDRARRAGAIAVSLGSTRLRTETAAVVAAALTIEALTTST